MPSNIVLCFDGTSNKFGPNNTNIVRLVQVLNRDEQRLYYDPGIGTLPEPGFITRVAKQVAIAFDLAFATSLTRKVESAYRFLMDFWEPGSNVYLFGFSRGAYTARVLAGMLHSLGLLSRGNHSLVPYVMRLFRSIRGDDESKENYWRLCNGFRWTFARQTDNDQRRFKIHFLGLWDTVSSVGWAWEPLSFPFTKTNPSVENARHAVSLDERRAFFRQNLLSTTTRPDQDWKERWFPGVHADVGGGYADEDGRLWLLAFDWMVSEARRFGLKVDELRLQRVRNQDSPAPQNAWAEPMHESLRGIWRVAEYYPKRRYREDGSIVYRSNLGRARNIPKGAHVDQSVLRRIREASYQPASFPEAVIDKIKAMANVPETYVVDW